MTKLIATAHKTALTLPQQRRCTCWLVKLRDGVTSYGFTDHDEDVVISGWSSPDSILHGTYKAEAGFSAKAVVTSDGLNVDNTQAHGVLTDDRILEEDLHAGLWDFARVYIFRVFWDDITKGPEYARVGWLGEVQWAGIKFTADIRGLMQLYTRTMIDLTSPMCRVKRLGDNLCKVGLGGSPTYIVTAGVDDVAADNQTFFSSVLTQPGPSSGVAVTNITNANPAVISLADASLKLQEGQTVSLSGVQGMTTINGNVVVRNPTDTTFEIDTDTTDTSDYPPYTSGGTVIPLGAGSGFFEYGIVEWLTGANAGLEMEVKSYVPGQVTLALPMPFPISGAGDSPTDTFRVTAGCDRSFTTCRDRFHNPLNFRGEPYVQGIDKLVQLGREAT